MPNWCDTQYKIIGKKEEVADLYSKIQQLQNMNEPLEPNGFGNLWLGCLVKLLGGDYGQIYCRGHIIDFGYENDVIGFSVESAWNEMAEVRQFLQQTYPSLKIFYYEEEPEWVSIKQTITKKDSSHSAISLMTWMVRGLNTMTTLIHYSQLHLKFSVKS